MQTLNSVLDKLVAFETTSLSGRVDNGTAFWLKINGSMKLVTASHIPWPQSPVSQPTPVISGEIFQVRWSMHGGHSGAGSAQFLSAPTAPSIDYAWMEFLDSAQAPPSTIPFLPASAPPQADTAVAATGFPGLFSLTPSANHAVGIVNSVQPLSNGGKISVIGSASGGYSGGPAFEYIDEGKLGDEVIGLMCGAPSAQATSALRVAASYILQGAVSFV